MNAIVLMVAMTATDAAPDQFRAQASVQFGRRFPPVVSPFGFGFRDPRFFYPGYPVATPFGFPGYYDPFAQPYWDGFQWVYPGQFGTFPRRLPWWYYRRF